MNNSLEIMRLRVLQCLLHSDPKDCTVTVIAHTLKVEKYAISRLVAALEREGLVYRTERRKILLTEHGNAEAIRYSERIEDTINHLIYEGVDMDSAYNDALHWALYNSDSTMEVVRASSELYRVKYAMRGQKNFSGSVFCRNMKDGVYQFPFMLYKEHAENGNHLSMANAGFMNPCSFCVEHGVGTIQLCVLDMTVKSGKNGNVLRGRVKNLHYFEYGQFYKAEINGNIVSFPASCLQFVNIGKDASQILYGSVFLRMECSCGSAHMPESNAIFSLFI
ncbi:MAG: MarR family transcriptional regulator [Brotaphodocola sp.]